jgi:hypothetical protein
VRHRGERDEQGRALVVRNGRGQGRKLTLGAGTVELKAPRVETAAVMNKEVASASRAPCHEDLFSSRRHPYAHPSPG